MEIEVKILEIDPAEMRQRLKSAGCEPIKREFQTNHMYDFPDRRLEAADCSYIRLRVSQDLDNGETTTLLTLKKTVSRDAFKSAHETETWVSDFQAMHEFLIQVGLEQIRIDEKIRETYQGENIHFEIDEWAGIPPYLEVEATCKEDVKKGLEMIGYSLEDATSKNLKEVLAMYGIQSNHLRFPESRHLHIRASH